MKSASSDAAGFLKSLAGRNSSLSALMLRISSSAEAKSVIRAVTSMPPGENAEPSSFGESIAQMLRLVAAILLMTVTTQAWAEKRYNSPKAKACRAEAAEKFPPTKWVPLDPSKPSGLKSTENYPQYKAHYDECMKRAD